MRGLDGWITGERDPHGPQGDGGLDREEEGMSEAAHTPGPWSAVSPSSRYVVGPSGDGDEDGYPVIARIEGKWAMRDANAHLIAAAPDLLAALLEQSLASDYGDVPCFCGDDARNPPLTEPHIPSCERARAAIAKAHGQDVAESGSTP